MRAHRHDPKMEKNNPIRRLATTPVSRWSTKGRSSEDAQSRLKRGFIIPDVEPSFSIPMDKPIFTIGSCFARNIEEFLAAAGAHVPTKSIVMDYAKKAGIRPNSVLNKYNLPSILQELQWALEPDQAFDEDYLIENKNGFVDPHLDDNTPEGARREILARHQQVSKVFEEIRGVSTIVITLGMIEAWFDKKHGLYLNTAPPVSAISADPERFDARFISYGENQTVLEQCVDLIFLHAGDDARMILTVSPVAMNATFSGRDVIVANSQSKCTLVALAQQIAKSDRRIDYFPSFESVLWSDPHFAWQPDRQHASPSMVDTIVAEFLHRYAGQEKPVWPDFSDDRANQVIDELHAKTKKLNRMVSWYQTKVK